MASAIAGSSTGQSLIASLLGKDGEEILGIIRAAVVLVVGQEKCTSQFDTLFKLAAKLSVLQDAGKLTDGQELMASLREVALRRLWQLCTLANAALAPAAAAADPAAAAAAVPTPSPEASVRAALPKLVESVSDFSRALLDILRPLISDRNIQLFSPLLTAWSDLKFHETLFLDARLASHRATLIPRILRQMEPMAGTFARDLALERLRPKNLTNAVPIDPFELPPVTRARGESMSVRRSHGNKSAGSAAVPVLRTSVAASGASSAAAPPPPPPVLLSVGLCMCVPLSPHAFVVGSL